MACVAGLHLKIVKCVLVPIFAPYTLHIREQVLLRLRALIPDWAFFQVVALGKYIGYKLGPCLCQESWEEPIAKWSTRTDQIAGSQASPAVSTYMYNTKALPCLQYVAQLALPPPSIKKKENAVANKLWHSPPDTITQDFAEKAAVWGGSALSPIIPALLAALVRAATKTINWKDPLGILERGVRDDVTDVPIARSLVGKPWDKHWTTPPIAHMLKQVVDGTIQTGVKGWDTAIKAGVSAARTALADGSKVQAAARLAIAEAEALNKRIPAELLDY